MALSTPSVTKVNGASGTGGSAEYQDRYGYPALTSHVKSRVLGLNAAELFGMDPRATRCALAADTLPGSRPVRRAGCGR